MADDSDLTAKQTAGCIVLVLHLFITGPIWYVLLFGVLQRTDAPAWQWALYWLYVPAGIIAILVSHLARMLLSDD